MARKIEVIDSLDFKPLVLKDGAQDLLDDLISAGGKPNLAVTIDATHSGRLTNLRVYPGKQMKAGADSFLKPYAKPVLKHHDDMKDAIGRVTGATYVQLKRGDDFNKDFVNPSNGEGSGFIKLETTIFDQDSIEKFVDGRFTTVSTRQSIQGLFCSICGEDFSDYDSECNHLPGKTYKVASDRAGSSGSSYMCFGITGKLSYKEVSPVNVPGDDHALVTGFETIKQDSEEIFVIHSKEDLMAEICDMKLSNGAEMVGLIQGLRSDSKGPMTYVTSEDRQKLTGKTIIAISPLFNSKNIEETTMDKDKKDEDVQEETNETTVDETASDDNSSSTSEETTAENKEGVVAPEEEADNKADEEKTEEVEAEKSEDTDSEGDDSPEILRLKAKLHDRDEQLSRVRQTLTDAQTELRTAYATALFDKRSFLNKTDASNLKGDERTAMIEGYAKRTIESLKDAIADLSNEISEIKPTALGSKDLLDKPKTKNPVRGGLSRSTTDQKKKVKSKNSRQKEKVTSFNQYLSN